MNNFQQNSINVRLTSVTVIQVTFNNIVVDSSINILLNRLKVAFGELDRHINLKMPVNETKGKGIQVNSIIETLMNSTNEIEFKEKTSFVKRILESSALIISKYKDALKIEGFGVELLNELIKYNQEYFQTHFSRFLDDHFWWSLKLYEWLQKEDFIAPDRSYWIHSSNKPTARYFSDQYLEDFFSENRGNIIKTILNCDHCNSKISFSNPLSNKEYVEYFEAYKLIQEQKI